jgi:hypothetical protein
MCTKCSTGIQKLRVAISVPRIQNMKRSEYEEDVIRTNAERQTLRNFILFPRRHGIVASHVLEASHPVLSCVL